MFNLDDIINENNEDHDLKWSYIPDHPYTMLIVGDSGSGDTNALLNLMKEQDSDSLIDKIYLYAKDLNELKYQFLIKKRENTWIKRSNDLKAFIEYSQCMDGVYNNIDYYNPSRKIKVLTVFDDMIPDTKTNKRF